MTFDWSEYLGLARLLVSQANLSRFPEAVQRTAVSRAYYAAFCTARNYAETRSGFRRTGGPQDHRSLREYLKKLGRVQLASRLNQLRTWRNICDYQDHAPNIQQCAQSAIHFAAQVIQDCR